jgi:hypothetical protein
MGRWSTSSSPTRAPTATPPKICRRIADVLQPDDLDVDLCDLGIDDQPDPSQHDGVIVAASIHSSSDDRPSSSRTIATTLLAIASAIGDCRGFG